MGKNNIHINFTGASGTGKTTLLKAFKEKYPGIEVRTEVVRNLIKEKGIKINEMGDEDGQRLIFGAYEDFLKRHIDEDYVSDRCVIDPLAYTIIHVANHQIRSEVLDEQWQTVKNMVMDGLLDKVFYFPIEFANVHDGVRSDDEDFRKETDAAIRGVLADLKREYPGFKVIEVRGDVGERLKIIESEMGLNRDLTAVK